MTLQSFELAEMASSDPCVAAQSSCTVLVKYASFLLFGTEL